MHFTPIAYGAARTSANINAPMSELSDAIDAETTTSLLPSLLPSLPNAKPTQPA